MSCTSHLFPLPLPHPLSLPCSLLLPAACLVLDGWRRQELALKEEDKEFFDELREDCDLRGEGRGGEREGEGIPVREVVSTHYINSVCWSGSAL